MSSPKPPQTDTNAQGASVTILWRAIRSNKEDRVAKFEWAPGGGLGRVIIGKVRLSPQRIPHSTCFLRSHLVTERLSYGRLGPTGPANARAFSVRLDLFFNLTREI